MTTTDVPMPRCQFCGASPSHPVANCPLVKAIEYYPDGGVKRIEKFEPLTKLMEDAK